jgi:hypothetical protein
MFALPSLWNLIISTLVFFIAARYIHRYLEEQGLPKGIARGTLVFSLASLVSWGSGETVDWTERKIVGTHPTVQTQDELSQLLKMVDQVQQINTEKKEPGSN